MADQKLTQLSDLPSPLPTDDLYVVSDPGGTPVSKRATIQHVVQAVSGGLYLLESHTASSSATLDFTTFISSTYDTYLFQIVSLVAATSTAHLTVRMGTGAGPSWDSGSNYQWALAQGSSAAAQGNAGSASDTSMRIANSMSNTATKAAGGSLTLYDPQSTSVHKPSDAHMAYTDSTPNFQTMIASGLYLSTTAVTGVRFLMSSGNIASGTIRAYGIGK